MAHADGDLETPIGEVVRKWREAHGWTVTELARRAKLDKGYVSQVERGKIQRPKLPHLRLLATALGVEDIVLVTHQLPRSPLESASQSEPPTLSTAAPTGTQPKQPTVPVSMPGSSGAAVRPSPLRVPLEDDEPTADASIREEQSGAVTAGEHVDNLIAALPPIARPEAVQRILDIADLICRGIRSRYLKEGSHDRR